MKKIGITLIGGIILLLASQCSPGNPDTAENAASPGSGEERLNVIVLLDLSNRLIKTPGQIDKDQAVIKEILTAFERRQKSQAYITSSDKISVLVAPQPNVPTGSNDGLVIDMAALNAPNFGDKNATIGLPAFKKEKATFETALAQLYAEASANPHTGADIYTFFCSDFKANFLNENAQNKVIILTDGYLLFDKAYLSQRPKCSYMRELDRLRKAKKDWLSVFERKELALCPCPASSFPNTEVIMLETAPMLRAQSVFEYNIIEHYWKDWFVKMNVDAKVYPHDDLVSNIGGKVSDFLEK